MKIFRNITAGHPEKLVKPGAYTILANIIGMLPFGLAIAAIQIIFKPFVTPGTTLDIAKLWMVVGALILSMLIMFLAEIPAYRHAYRDAYMTAAEGRANLAEHMRKLPLGYLFCKDAGMLGNMMMGDFTMVESGMSHVVPKLMGALVTPVLAFIGLAFMDWRMSLSMFAAMPVALLIIIGTSKLQKVLGRELTEAKVDASNRLQEYLTGIRVIKSCNMTGEHFQHLEGSFYNLMKKSIKMEGLLQSIVLTVTPLLRAGLTVMIYVGSYLLMGGTLTIMTLATFLVIGTRIFEPLSEAIINLAELRYDAQAGERIIKFMEEPVMSGEKSPPASNDIELQHVDFSYDNVKVLKNVSTKMKEGTLTALVGPSGSGKSTVLKLVARFYDPQQGKVLLGKEDMKEMNPESLLKRISMVFQDVYLFQDTIGNNIRFGREDATQKEVEEAAKKACCHDFIMKLPQGYDTAVGEGGCTLSGGEKQRVSIARAMLKDAPVVLLDEATASLDPENEMDVQKAINQLIKGRTVIVIAHKLKTIRSADNIIVLDDGRVVEQGKHEELIKLKGLYARLWKLQQVS
ncbi:ABC transporter ATP-binding protein [Clostridium botulinum]|uniref:Composite ABC transporter, ATP-binding/permease protein n=1 Tax=Clostridium botulinum (strain Hall / ATCC 3502 / NCTC 13319 / Type A) TaxID=441771 RepID=A5I0P4_CLOBH|nr:ABC transporter ATP-binding protein [Clostridium botulinum]EPS50296.1 ABC transport ATP-binding protein/permease [Clostridium botulinum CFSAN002369]ABS34022.1 ABC transport ATP-binding/permease protein [Clostridium botulinum A str. ATCC 19397]ABS38529.1 ABC transport ATP-binding/permease protein [Clostridium botulinum A str. Hall]AWB16970.1 ABC transporter ATP-binding protein [Clostridium botulinum]AWB29767.1 ABC transporter ATP-binding protein [Clostridium botulinum]